MRCKFCGSELKSSTVANNVPILVARFGGQKCFQSSHGKHIACSGDNMVCKYCGETVRSGTTGNNVPVLLGRMGHRCSQSPHGKHELVE